jgi:hypothetical protein
MLIHNIVTFPLEARIVEPEETDVARERLGKHASSSTDTHATIRELLETVFSIRLCRGNVRRANWSFKTDEY